MFRKRLLIPIIAFLLLFTCTVINTVNAEITSVSSLQDVKSSHWAYQAVKDLVEKYGIQGYPDETFKGNDSASRFEMAAALDEVAITIGEQMAKLGIDKADRKDLETVMKLQQEFCVELAAFKLRAEAIERKNLEQDTQLTDHNLRIEKIEKVKQKRDIVLLNQSDMGKEISDGMSATFRVRQDTEVTYNQDNPESIWGEGKGFFRLTAAVGRVSPLNSVFPTGTILSLYNDIAAVDSATASDTTRRLGFFSNTRPVAFIEQAYISQDLHVPGHSGRLTLNGGLMDITNWFDNNAVANNETTQFMNFALTNNRMFTSAYIAPSAVATLCQPLLKDRLTLSLKAGIISLDHAKLDGEFTAMYEGGLQYFIKNKEGNMRVGGYNGYINTSDLIFVPGRINDRNHNGVYISADQQLYRNTRVFARYGVADSGPATEGLNNVRQAMSFGAEFHMRDFLPMKRDDVLGVAYAFATPCLHENNNPDGFNSTSEKIIEAYYKFQVNDMFSIGPDFQIIMDPGGFHGPTLAVLGLRTYLVF